MSGSAAPGTNRVVAVNRECNALHVNSACDANEQRHRRRLHGAMIMTIIGMLGRKQHRFLLRCLRLSGQLPTSSSVILTHPLLPFNSVFATSPSVR